MRLFDRLAIPARATVSVQITSISSPVETSGAHSKAPRRRYVETLAWMFGIGIGAMSIIDLCCAAQYVQTFGHSLSASVHTLDATLDGGSVVGGSDPFSASGGPLDAFVMRLDRDGNRLWTKRFGEFSRVDIVRRASDDGYLVLVRNDLMRLDADGNVRWRKTFSAGAGEIEIHSMEATGDGGCLLTGDQRNDLKLEGWVAKVDAGGAISWQRNYRGQGVTYMWSGVQIAESEYVVTGHTYLDASNTQIAGVVMKLGATGALVWQKFYSGLFSITSISRSAVGSEFLVVGNWRPGGAWLAKLDTDGNVLWQYTYAGISARPVRSTRDGDILMLAFGRDTGGWVSVWAKVDARGELLWMRRLPSGWGAGDIRQTSDGGFLIVGSSDAAGLLLKVDVDGDLPGCDLLGTATVAKFESTSSASGGTLTEGVGDALTIPGTSYAVNSSDAPTMRCKAVPNYQGLWWNSPSGSESGWGINLAHQSDVIFATWYTYDWSGKAWWLSISADKTDDGVYSGVLYETIGPPFNSHPFDPNSVTRTPVGTGVMTFASTRRGTFAYTVNGISQSKAIVPQEFGALPTCTWGAQPDLTKATNYQDLWWASPPDSESGWGVNFAQQGDKIFATWYTYDFDGAPLWLSATAPKTATGTYTGMLYRTTGPAFNAVPFDPNSVTRDPVGTLTLTFANGNAASFAYTVTLPGSPPVTQTKQVTRQVFRAPGTVCQ